MATVEHTSPFLNLPLELREQIYRTVLSSSSQSPDLLRTCREVHTEARKFLYQRTVTFRSQGIFNAWSAATPNDMLDQVSKMSLSIQDVDLRPILATEASISQTRTPPRLMTWDLYQTELDRLEQALRKVPKVKTITIRTPPCQPSFLYHDFMEKILELLSVVYPGLRDLQLDGNFHSHGLLFLSTLEKLVSFSFGGFSGSSPSDTMDILSNLKCLKNLSLISKDALLTPTVGIRSGFTAKRQSFTGDVVRTISQRASFTVTPHASASSPTQCFISEVLSSLLRHKPLKSLSIHLAHAPDAAVLSLLETLLEEVPLERLELDWLDLQPTVIERYGLLNEHLKVFWVRVMNEAAAFEILWLIGECREAGDLRLLEKVVLIRSAEALEHVCNLGCDREDSGMGNFDIESCMVSSPVLALRRENAKHPVAIENTMFVYLIQLTQLYRIAQA